MFRVLFCPAFDNLKFKSVQDVDLKNCEKKNEKHRKNKSIENLLETL